MRTEQQVRRYYVSGMVHGVGYRFFAQRIAERLGVRGYVRNLRDGRVEVYAVGSEASLVALVRELQQGPEAAVVSEVVEEQADFDPRYERGFSIEFSGL